MANLRKWSTTATGNASVAGGANTINFAEGQTPGSVNNSAREMMAQVRGIYTPSEWGWVENSATVSVASQTTFKLANNQTTDWTAGRRWRLKSGSTTRYGSVVSSSYTTETTITVTVDGGVSLSASHSLAALSPIDASSNQLPLAQQSFLRNRIINGDMRIDQRNAGASVTINSGVNTYVMDRWFGVGQTTDGVFTVARSGVGLGFFSHGLLATVTTADASIGATQSYAVAQKIEGNNVSDFSFGNSNAKSITLSFWTFSTVTGTFGGAIANEAHNRSCPFTYTINAANTWEYKTITLPGDTGGTWVTDSNSAMRVIFSLGAGSSLKGTAGTWAAATYWSATGATDLISTLSAQQYITGVQLEAGSVATAFERRQYGHELALCQRYYQKSYDTSVAPGTASASGAIALFPADTSALTRLSFGSHRFVVQMRSTPTVTLYGTNGSSGAVSLYNNSATTLTFSSFNTQSSTCIADFATFSTSATSGQTYLAQYTASAEL